MLSNRRHFIGCMCVYACVALASNFTSNIHKQFNEHEHRANAQKCRECGIMSPFKGGTISCSAKSSFKSVVFFNCRYGLPSFSPSSNVVSSSFFPSRFDTVATFVLSSSRYVLLAILPLLFY